ncbi:MocR-like pyridoxine biosynthesis transcription factor PdxR [Terriglobus albidus]|uniref:MocR-like pyridoxine biosynthesis transcription factor PdxR n=1 Tax=Terriglobus albidus TaxID=1592106 RepID=UPI0021DF6111|nr:PLP-dependent aminotransferase family protein [Terriglobus albidus]
MPKTETFQDLVLEPRKDDQEMWRWLYTELRSAIIDGRLKSGARLPSTRNLAAQYGFARGTVVAAFQQLQDEGYVSSEVSAGTFVLPAPGWEMTSPVKPRSSRQAISRATIAKRTQGLLKTSFLRPASHSVGKAFRGYEPAIDLFPVEQWARIAARVYRKAPRSLYGQGDAGGYPPLRRAIAEYVGQSRGVRCSADQIIVTSGAQQALDLLARVLLDPGDEVWMEDPGYPGASRAFQNAGASVIPIPVDGDGIDVGRAIKLSPAARAVYVTPANQFPLGVVMSAERRVELLSWAVRAGAWIIEDEYDAEYRYSGKPIASLHSLDPSGSVMYVGTFTKMLFNALRIGFIVVPERFVEAFRIARSFMDRHAPTLDQAVLTEFINEGHFGRHVRKMRQVYSERSQLLTDEANRRLSGLIEVEHAQSGMCTVAWIKTRITEMGLTRRAKQLGLEVSPISSFVSKYEQKPALFLGFAGCNANEIKRGVSVLEAILSR